MASQPAAVNGGVYYDPYKRSIAESPYPIYKRMREEAPLYYNSEYDFYALTRYNDVRAAFLNHQALSSKHGDILEMIQQKIQIPPGTFIHNDPPSHAIHRNIVARIFSPRRMNGLEVEVRDITRECLDKIAGEKEFDFIEHIGGQIPMRVIGKLLGIPEQDFEMVRESVDSRLRTEGENPLEYESGSLQLDQSFGDYIDWRMKNPADDVITELLGVEFTDETGTQRKLTRDELITYVNILAGAGNETTNKLIGWAGKTLAEFPDQRKLLVENRELIPEAVEELLRFEPPGPHVARYVTEDIEFHGTTVPAGSALLMIVASANRDESIFPNPDVFDIRRDRAAHVTFGYGIHTCIGNVLARMEGRVVLDELLNRFPEWEVDLEEGELLATSTVRGWATLPAWVGKEKPARKPKPVAPAGAPPPASIEGRWNVTIKGPTGPMPSELYLAATNGVLGGEQSGDGTTTVIEGIDYDAASGAVRWVNKVTKPMKLKLEFTGQVEGNTMTGKVKAGFMGSYPFTGQKL
ncbi:cytochrome P450 [Haliea sp. E17]|uniref:cytochrome P450 n=1 Tax=Haliea sp. E17 TaxID=3401576 RepID=UPI003AAB66AF